MTKRKKIQVFDYHDDRVDVDETFEKEDVVSWQIFNDSKNGREKIGIEWIEDKPVEIDEYLCLVCMTNQIDGDCAIRLAWKGGEEERVNSFTCLVCFDELQNNQANIDAAVERRDKKYGFWSDEK